MAWKVDEGTRKRVRAGRMLLANKPIAEVAGAVGVARQTVYTWKARLDEGGVDTLRTMARRRPSLLADAQREQLCHALLPRPTEHVGTELWTLKRVRLLIEQRFGVSCNEAHVWRLPDSLGFSPQRLDRRTIERDEDAVLTWKQKAWPALKKVYAGATADCLH